MSDGATQSYVDKWLAIQPQQRIALGFVDPAVRDERVALAAFEQELISRHASWPGSQTSRS